MNIGLMLVVAFALCALVFFTHLTFVQTRMVGKTITRGFIPMFSVSVFAILLYEVDKKSPISHVDNVMFALLVAFMIFATLRLLFRYAPRIRNVLKKKFPNIGRLYSKV